MMADQIKKRGEPETKRDFSIGMKERLQLVHEQPQCHRMYFKEREDITGYAQLLFIQRQMHLVLHFPNSFSHLLPLSWEIRVARRVGDESWRGKPIDDRLTPVQRQCARTPIGY